MVKIACERLLVVEIWHEGVVAEIWLEEDAGKAKLIDLVADLALFVFCMSPV